MSGDSDNPAPSQGHKFFRIMKKVYCFGYYVQNIKSVLYYCYDKTKGAYLSQDINNAHIYNKLDIARRDMFRIMKHFFIEPVSCSIFMGTK